MKTLCGIMVAVLLLSADLAHGTVRRVPAQYPTIQAGINACIHGDTVLVADSTYFENISFRGKAITVASHFILDQDTAHISRTIINGSQPSHLDSGSVVFFISGEDTNSVLCGFTITGGTGTTSGSMARSGGGVLCRNSGAKIMHNIIENNHVTSSTIATSGGGINGGPPGGISWLVIDSNTIRNNSVTNMAVSGEAVGGGISVFVNARVINNIVEFDTAQSTYGAAYGGGVALVNHQPLDRYVIHNKIWHNKALAPTGTYVDGGIGGGLFVGDMPRAEIRLNDIRYNEIESNAGLNIECWGGGVHLTNQNDETVFAQNYVAFNKAMNNSLCRGAGMAIWNYDVSGGPQMVNNIIAHNAGGTWGGGVFAGGLVSNATIFINNTICSDSATYGGGIYIGYDAAHPSYPIILNSILWDNSSSIFVNYGSSDTVICSDVEGGYAGFGNITADPQFVDTTYRLADTSPCLQTAIDSAQIDGTWYRAPSLCFYGMPRPSPAGTRPDIGACESDHLVGFVAEPPRTGIPKSFALEQNYPNPFNPSTIISYQLPSQSHVTLKMYDVLGREVATLVNEVKSPGTYTVQWNATSVASGVYLYRLQAGQFSAVQKMLLVR